jgi:hypothetical protein
LHQHTEIFFRADHLPLRHGQFSFEPVARKRGLFDVRIEETRKIGIAEHVSIGIALTPQDGMGAVAGSHMAPVGQELRWGCPQSTFKRQIAQS